MTDVDSYLREYYSARWPYTERLGERWINFVEENYAGGQPASKLKNFLERFREGVPSMLVAFGSAAPEDVEAVRIAAKDIRTIVRRNVPEEFWEQNKLKLRLLWFIPERVKPEQVLPALGEDEPSLQAARHYFQMQPYISLWDVRLERDEILFPEQMEVLPIGAALVADYSSDADKILERNLKTAVRKHYSDLIPAMMSALGHLRLYEEDDDVDIGALGPLAIFEIFAPASVEGVHNPSVTLGTAQTLPALVTREESGKWVFPRGDIHLAAIREGWLEKLATEKVPAYPVKNLRWFSENLRVHLGRWSSLRRIAEELGTNIAEAAAEKLSLQSTENLQPSERFALFVRTESAQCARNIFSCMSAVMSPFRSPMSTIIFFVQKSGLANYFWNFFQKKKEIEEVDTLHEKIGEYLVRTVQGRFLGGPKFFTQLYTPKGTDFGYVPQRARTLWETETSILQTSSGALPLQGILSPGVAHAPGWGRGDLGAEWNWALAQGDLSVLEPYSRLLQAAVAVRMRAKPQEVWGRVETLRKPGRPAPEGFEYNFWYEPRKHFQDFVSVWYVPTLGSEIQSTVQEVGRGRLPESIEKIPAGSGWGEPEKVVYVPREATQQIALSGELSHTGIAFFFPEVHLAALHAVGLYGYPASPAGVYQLTSKLFSEQGLRDLAEAFKEHSKLETQYKPVQPEEVHRVVDPDRVYIIPLLGSYEGEYAPWDYGLLAEVPGPVGQPSKRFFQKETYGGGAPPGSLGPYRGIHLRDDRIRMVHPHIELLDPGYAGIPMYGIPIPLVRIRKSFSPRRNLLSLGALNEAVQQAFQTGQERETYSRRMRYANQTFYFTDDVAAQVEAIVLGDIERLWSGAQREERVVEAAHRDAYRFMADLTERLRSYGFAPLYAVPTGMDEMVRGETVQTVPRGAEREDDVRHYAKYFKTETLLEPKPFGPVLVGWATPKGAEFLAYRTTPATALAAAPSVFASGLMSVIREIAPHVGVLEGRTGTTQPMEVKEEPTLLLLGFLGNWSPGIVPRGGRVGDILSAVPKGDLPHFQEALRLGLRIPLSYMITASSGQRPFSQEEADEFRFAEFLDPLSPPDPTTGWRQPMIVARIGRLPDTRVFEPILDALLRVAVPAYRSLFPQQFQTTDKPVAKIAEEPAKLPADIFHVDVLTKVPESERLWAITPGVQPLLTLPQNVVLWRGTLFSHSLGTEGLQTVMRERANVTTPSVFEDLWFLTTGALQKVAKHPELTVRLLARLKSVLGGEATSSSAYHGYGLIPPYAQRPGREVYSFVVTPSGRPKILNALRLKPVSGFVLPLWLGLEYRPINEEAAGALISLGPAALDVLHGLFPGSELRTHQKRKKQETMFEWDIEPTALISVSGGAYQITQTPFMDQPLPASVVQSLHSQRGLGKDLILHNTPVDLPPGQHAVAFVQPGTVVHEDVRREFIHRISFGMASPDESGFEEPAVVGAVVIPPFVWMGPPYSTSAYSGMVQGMVLFPGLSQETSRMGLSSLKEAIEYAITAGERARSYGYDPHRQLVQESARRHGIERVYEPVLVGGGLIVPKQVFR